MDIGSGGVGKSHVETIVTVSIQIPAAAPRPVQQYADVARLTSIVPNITVEVTVEITSHLQMHSDLGQFDDVGRDHADILDARSVSVRNRRVNADELVRAGYDSVQRYRAHL